MLHGDWVSSHDALGRGHAHVAMAIALVTGALTTADDSARQPSGLSRSTDQRRLDANLIVG